MHISDVDHPDIYRMSINTWKCAYMDIHNWGLLWNISEVISVSHVKFNAIVKPVNVDTSKLGLLRKYSTHLVEVPVAINHMKSQDTLTIWIHIGSTTLRT